MFGFLGGLLAPFRALFNPVGFYRWLRKVLRRYGLYAMAVVYVGSWIAASLAAFLLILLVEAFRAVKAGNVLGLLSAPARALLYSLVFPVIPALVDALIIMAAVAPFPRERPLYDVFAVRASSLLPYTLRVVVLEAQGRLSLRTLAAATPSVIGILLLIIGALMTMYGLRRTMGASMAGAVLGGLLPLSYKLALGLL